MALLGIILLVIFIISAILLIIIVLLQDDQGEGIGGLFGGGSSTAFGSRSGNVLTKFTSILGAIFMVCSFGLAWVNKSPEKGDVLGAARREAVSEKGEYNWWDTEEQFEAVQPSTQENDS